MSLLFRSFRRLACGPIGVIIASTILTTDRGRILDLIGVVNFGEYALLLTSPGEQQRVID